MKRIGSVDVSNLAGLGLKTQNRRNVLEVRRKCIEKADGGEDKVDDDNCSLSSRTELRNACGLLGYIW